MDTDDLISRVDEWSIQLQDDVDAVRATTEAVNTFTVVVCT